MILDRPIFSSLLKGKTTQDKEVAAIKMGFTHRISYTYNGTIFYYYCRTLEGAERCKKNIEELSAQKDPAVKIESL